MIQCCFHRAQWTLLSVDRTNFTVSPAFHHWSHQSICIIFWLPAVYLVTGTAISYQQVHFPGIFMFISVELQKVKGHSKSAILYKYRINLILVYSVYSITLSNFSIFSQTSLKWVYGILWHFMGSWHFENAHWLWITILNFIRLEKEIWKH